MHEHDLIRLRHMLDAARKAVEISTGRARSDLDSDIMLMLSLIKLIEIIGEAANQVSDSGRELAANIPWVDIISMRNRLVHAYFEINLDILWQTMEQDIPELIESLEDVVDNA